VSLPDTTYESPERLSEAKIVNSTDESFDRHSEADFVSGNEESSSETFSEVNTQNYLARTNLPLRIVLYYKLPYYVFQRQVV